jgi:hypothetical protein
MRPLSAALFASLVGTALLPAQDPALSAAAVSPLFDGRVAPADQLPPVPRPGAAPEITLAQIADARDRGVAWLLANQQPSGAWGSPGRTKGLNIAADVPGAHYAFMTATTGLAIEALILSVPETPEVKAALDKAEAWLLDFLPRVKRPNQTELYNTWAHSYSMRALLLLSQRPGVTEEQKSKLLAAARGQIERLQTYEFIDGGWGYYDFDMATRKPSGIGTSFTTATALIALHQARGAGLDVPQKMVDNAVRAILMQRTRDGSYVYSFGHRMRPRGGINRPAGSLGRAPACNAALRHWTDTRHVSDQDIRDWLDRLITRGGWIEKARKFPVPHEAWFQNSGYFYYYGQYYAAWCVNLLPEKDRPFYRAHLAETLLRLQEKDGTWWDFPLYDYHQAYGTAYTLSALSWLEPDLKKTGIGKGG